MEATILASAVMPIEKRNTILKVFGKLRQRVVWKFEDDTKMTDIPANVMIRKWAPQNDILAHNNTILFISHGGQFGTFEAMHHGVPTLFLPFFGDQNRNADRAIRMGFARKMLFVNITEQSFGDNIAAMVDGSSQFFRRAKEISRLFTDRIVEPMEESIFWMEYVARHGGAAHLKSKAVELNWFQYYMLDSCVSSFAFGMGIIRPVRVETLTFSPSSVKRHSIGVPCRSDGSTSCTWFVTSSGLSDLIMMPGYSFSSATLRR
uniref:UDP-glucuronosyltransferase n=1 Tax=Anopheles atroparvus TaxID=41427 RepID=A0A182IXE9_ANOAO